MSNSLLHRCGRLLLSVAMAATSGVSPGVTHAHADGDSPHTHAADSKQASRYDSGHHHHHHRSHHHDVAHHKNSHDHVALVEAGTWHTHTSLFGWPISIPTKDGKHAEGNSDVSGLKVEIASAPSDLQPAASSVLFFQSLLAPPPTIPWLTTDDLLSIYHPPDARRSLLCDTARRERSGVLLA